MADTVEEQKSILAAEADTADHAAKGASNLAWVRLNAFMAAANALADKYKFGKAVYEAEPETWAQDMSSVRHGLEMLFGEFNRAQYYKNVAREATKRSDEMAEENQSDTSGGESGDEANKEECEKDESTGSEEGEEEEEGSNDQK